MTEVALDIQEIAGEGLDPVYTGPTSAADGVRYENKDNRTWLEVNNDSGADITVTAKGQKECSFGLRHDRTFTAPDAVVFRLPVLRQDQFNDGDGSAHVAFSTITGVTVAAVRAKG